MTNELTLRPQPQACRKDRSTPSYHPTGYTTGRAGDAGARLGPHAGVLWLTLTGPAHGGHAPVVVFSYADEYAGPRHLSVSSTEEMVVPTPHGRYDLAVVGTDGFRREQRGVLAQEVGAEVASEVDVQARELRLLLHNRGTDDLSYTVSAGSFAGNAGNAAPPAPTTVSVGPGMTRSLAWDLSPTQGWYDVTVTTPQDPTFARRLTGHVRRGRSAAGDGSHPA